MLLTLSDALVAGSAQGNRTPSGFIESDLPVQEGGEDLLGRRVMIEHLVSTNRARAAGSHCCYRAYGDGKTSFLNLTVGQLRKLDEDDRPVIVRFSPWLAADSNALVPDILEQHRRRDQG